MPRYKIEIEYNGTNFHGWQKQKNHRTIQGEIENALCIISREKISITGAGRTDAKVHALGQVAHFNMNAQRSERQIVYGLNALLKDITIIGCSKTQDSFHAQNSAKQRVYIYKIFNRNTRTSLYKNFTWHIPFELNIERMITASKFLIGRKDFSSFRAGGCTNSSPIKEIHYINISKSYNIVQIEIAANAFLYHMVRNITSSLVNIGLNKWDIEYMNKLILYKNRRFCAATAPASGLYLSKVIY